MATINDIQRIFFDKERSLLFISLLLLIKTQRPTIFFRQWVLCSSRIVHLQTRIILSVQKSETTTDHIFYMTMFTYRDFSDITRKIWSILSYSETSPEPTIHNHLETIHSKVFTNRRRSRPHWEKISRFVCKESFTE